MYLRVKRSSPRAVLPSFAYPGDAGMDLVTVKTEELAPGEARDLSTGLHVELPIGFWARITGRSSTMRKRGLLVNEGIIDNGYRGELFVYVKNLTADPVVVEAGARLAQLILQPIIRPEILECEELAESVRGSAGFGSSGLTTSLEPQEESVA